MALATFGGGCFWCIEEEFDKVKGVRSATSGYAGGHTDDPSYTEVCSGSTGHAEVVQVEYDPKAVDYRDLLDTFFAIHNPTTSNRQGPDVGSQYRSIILFHDQKQKEEALLYIEELNASGRFPAPIVTEVVPMPKFFPAEEYHQKYYRKMRG